MQSVKSATLLQAANTMSASGAFGLGLRVTVLAGRSGTPEIIHGIQRRSPFGKVKAELLPLGYKRGTIQWLGLMIKHLIGLFNITLSRVALLFSGVP